MRGDVILEKEPQRVVITAEPWEQDILPCAVLMLFLHGAIVQTHHPKMMIHLPPGVIERETYYRRDGGQQYNMTFPDGFVLVRNQTRVGTTYVVFLCKDLDEQPLALLQREPVFAEVDHLAIFHHRVILSDASGHLVEPGMILPVQLLEDTRTPEQPSGRTTVRILYPGHKDAFMTLLDTSITLQPLVSAAKSHHRVPVKPDDDRPHQLL